MCITVNCSLLDGRVHVVKGLVVDIVVLINISKLLTIKSYGVFGGGEFLTIKSYGVFGGGGF